MISPSSASPLKVAMRSPFRLQGDLPGAADPEAVAAAHRRGELAAYRHGGAFGQAQHVADARHIAEPDQRGGVAHLLMNHAPSAVA